MLSANMQEALNDQLNAEWYSSYLYLSMAAYFEATGLKGFANWMSVQAKEEWVHGEMFYGHINSRRGRVLLKHIAGPPTEWSSPLNAFEHVLEHEQMVTGRIHALVSQALQENDFAANAFLQWFVNEQVEEEESADAILQQLKLIGSNPHALLMLDRELALRVFTPPAAAAANGGGTAA